MSDIDYGSILEALNEKADLDLGNVTASVSSAFLKSDLTNTPQEMDFVIESYQNGTDWYRLYKSGWCEQGGHCSNLSSTQTIQFLKPFLDATYTLLVGVISDNSNNTSPRNVAGDYQGSPYQHVSASGFTYFGSTNRSFDWIACGYVYVS